MSTQRSFRLSDDALRALTQARDAMNERLQEFHPGSPAWTDTAVVEAALAEFARNVLAAAE